MHKAVNNKQVHLKHTFLSIPLRCMIYLAMEHSRSLLCTTLQRILLKTTEQGFLLKHGISNNFTTLIRQKHLSRLPWQSKVPKEITNLSSVENY